MIKTKHTETNENPFVDYLKAYEPIIEEIIWNSNLVATKDCRMIVFEETVLSLPNIKYNTFGMLMIPKEDLLSKTGKLIFYFNPEDPTYEADCITFKFNSEEELYDLITEIDSSENRVEAKNKISEMIVRENGIETYILI